MVSTVKDTEAPKAKSQNCMGVSEIRGYLRVPLKGY